MLAFGVTTVRSLEPTAGPRGGGTTLRLRCGGAYATDSITVRFAGDDTEACEVSGSLVEPGVVECSVPALRYRRPRQAAAALAEARAELATAEVEDDAEALQAARRLVAQRERLPDFLPAVVRLSLNSRDFTRETPAFTYYGAFPRLGPVHDEGGAEQGAPPPQPAHTPSLCPSATKCLLHPPRRGPDAGRHARSRRPRGLAAGGCGADGAACSPGGKGGGGRGWRRGRCLRLVRAAATVAASA